MESFAPDPSSHRVASPNAGQTGLNKLTFGNVAPQEQNRHIAHFLVAILLICEKHALPRQSWMYHGRELIAASLAATRAPPPAVWTLYLLYREFQHLIQVRQQWLASDQHLSLARTRTVMLVNVPKSLMDETALKELAGDHVGSAGAARVWLSRQCKDLEKVYDDRNQECARLEGAEAKLQALATKNVKKGKTPQPKSTSAKQSPSGPGANEGQGFDLSAETGGSDALIDKYVLPKKRPTWKQGFLGLIGRKMDLKESPEFIREKNEDIAAKRADLDSFEKGNVAFIRFNNQHDAHVFARVVDKGKQSLEMKMIQSGIEVKSRPASCQRLC
jgi:hypothetical protein